ncbi:MAG: hypothetical protein WKF70_03320 [Chitinophagaceae bacterium]
MLFDSVLQQLAEECLLLPIVLLLNGASPLSLHYAAKAGVTNDGVLLSALKGNMLNG